MSLYPIKLWKKLFGGEIPKLWEKINTNKGDIWKVKTKSRRFMILLVPKDYSPYCVPFAIDWPKN